MSYSRRFFWMQVARMPAPRSPGARPMPKGHRHQGKDLFSCGYTPMFTYYVDLDYLLLNDHRTVKNPGESMKRILRCDSICYILITASKSIIAMFYTLVQEG